jgi:DNA-binding protein H-NS
MSGHKDGNAVAVDLDRMSVQQLTALIEAAEAKRRDKSEEAKAALRTEVERKAAELGISVGDLFVQPDQRAPVEQKARGRRPRSDAGTKPPAKYRDPETGETWSGRGRPPRWLAAREAEGKRREEFAVEQELRLP